MSLDTDRLTTELELRGANRLWPKLNIADAAHLRALCEAKVLTPELEKSAKASLRLLSTLSAADLSVTGGDLFDQRKNIIRQRLNVPTGWMSLGRARREAVTVAFHLALREEFTRFQLELCTLTESLANLGRRHAETLFADFTYLIPSQPSTFGHFLSAYAGPFQRCLRTAAGIGASLNESPAGGGSTNGSRIPISRETLARELGFEGLVENTRDSVWRSDLMHETASLLATVCLMISRLANDFLLLSSPGVGFVKLSPSMERKSWILPQKNNPYALAMLRGTCSEVAALPQSVWMWNHTFSNQPDNRVHSHHQMLQGVQRGRECLELLTSILQSMQVNEETMKAACEPTSVRSADIAEILAMKGLDFESASDCVRQALQAGLEWSGDFQAGLEAALSKTGIKISADEIKKLTEPEKCIRAKSQTGSCSPQDVKNSAAKTIQRCHEMRKALEEQQRKISIAERLLTDYSRGE